MEEVNFDFFDPENTSIFKELLEKNLNPDTVKNLTGKSEIRVNLPVKTQLKFLDYFHISYSSVRTVLRFDVQGIESYIAHCPLGVDILRFVEAADTVCEVIFKLFPSLGTYYINVLVKTKLRKYLALFLLKNEVDKIHKSFPGTDLMITYENHLVIPDINTILVVANEFDDVTSEGNVVELYYSVNDDPYEFVENLTKDNKLKKILKTGELGGVFVEEREEEPHNKTFFMNHKGDTAAQLNELLSEEELTLLQYSSSATSIIFNDYNNLNDNEKSNFYSHRNEDIFSFYCLKTSEFILRILDEREIQIIRDPSLIYSYGIN